MPIGDEESSQLGDFIEDKNMTSPEGNSSKNILRDDLLASMQILIVSK